MRTIHSKSLVDFYHRGGAEVYNALGSPNAVPPTWGTAPLAKDKNLWDKHWDKTSSTLSWRKGKSDYVTNVPREESVVFQGVIDLYSRVEEAQSGAETGYYAEAKHYIRQVLNETVMAYTSKTTTQFKGFTVQLEQLWRASDFGSDLLHLSRGARCLLRSHPTTSHWTASQSRSQTVTAETPFLVSDEIKDLPIPLLRRLVQASPPPSEPGPNSEDQDMHNLAARTQRLSVAPSVSGSKRDAEDPDNQGEGVEDGGQADLHRKRLKSHHGGDEELQPVSPSRFLGGPWFTLKSLLTAIDIWRTAARTNELDLVDNLLDVLYEIRDTEPTAPESHARIHLDFVQTYLPPLIGVLEQIPT